MCYATCPREKDYHEQASADLEQAQCKLELVDGIKIPNKFSLISNNKMPPN